MIDVEASLLFLMMTRLLKSVLGGTIVKMRLLVRIFSMLITLT
jgi:hypothetical protein